MVYIKTDPPGGGVDRGRSLVSIRLPCYVWCKNPASMSVDADIEREHPEKTCGLLLRVSHVAWSVRTCVLEPGVDVGGRRHPARARLPARTSREDGVGAQEATRLRQPASPRRQRPRHAGQISAVHVSAVNKHCNIYTYLPSVWWRSTVVERRSLTGELSLSCARPAADG